MIQTKLNQYLQPINSPVTEVRRPNPMNFDVQQEVQGRLARLSNINVKNFIFQSGTADATFGLDNNGSAVIKFSSRNAPPHQSEPMWAQYYAAIFQGTTSVGSLQVYPGHGAGIDPTDYHIYSGFDYVNYAAGTTSNWMVSITNQSGGSLTFYVISRVKYIQYNAAISS